MSLNSLIVDTLRPLGVPVSFLRYTGKKTTYITFFEFNQRSALSGDDAEKATAYSIQVDIWSQGNYLNLVKQVKEAMTQAGFRRTFETELYEDESRYYHKVIRFAKSVENVV